MPYINCLNEMLNSRILDTHFVLRYCLLFFFLKTVVFSSGLASDDYQIAFFKQNCTHRQLCLSNYLSQKIIFLKITQSILSCLYFCHFLKIF